MSKIYNYRAHVRYHGEPYNFQFRSEESSDQIDLSMSTKAEFRRILKEEFEEDAYFYIKCLPID